MKKYIFILLSLTILIAGCDNKMDLIKKHINNLVENTEQENEKKLATELNNYSTDNHISYSLKFKKDDAASFMNASDLDKNMNKKLNVVIKINSGNWHTNWKPIDNKNIFILLRE